MFNSFFSRERVVGAIKMTPRVVGSAIVWLLRSIYDYGGLRWLVSRFSGRRPNDPEHWEPPSGVFWLLSIHFAVLAISNSSHQQSVAAYDRWVQIVPKLEIERIYKSNPDAQWCVIRRRANAPKLNFEPNPWDIFLVKKFLFREKEETPYQFFGEELTVARELVMSAFSQISIDAAHDPHAETTVDEISESILGELEGRATNARFPLCLANVSLRGGLQGYIDASDPCISRAADTMCTDASIADFKFWLDDVKDIMIEKINQPRSDATP